MKLRLSYMKKGVVGKVLTTIITLVLAIFGLVVLWLFLSGSVKHISTVIDKILKGMMCWVCNLMGWGARIMPGCGGC